MQSDRLVDGYELRSVRECAFDLDFGDHLRHAFHDIVNGEYCGPHIHQFRHGFSVPDLFEQLRGDQGYRLGVVQLQSAALPLSREFAGRKNHEFIDFTWSQVHMEREFGAPARMAMTESFTVRAAIDHWSRVYGVDPAPRPGARVVGVGVQQRSRLTCGCARRHAGDAHDMGVRRDRAGGRRIPRTTSGNVQVGVAYLNQLLRDFRGNVRLPWPRTSRARIPSGAAACSARPGSTSPACSR